MLKKLKTEKLITGRGVLLFIMLIFLTSFFQYSFAQKDRLENIIDQIIKSSKGQVGVAIMGLEDREKFLFNENLKLPMQSVFKFPLAMKVLEQVDKGKLTLDQKIHITKKDLLPDTWSPLREKYPEGNVDVTVAELLSFTVSTSDNNGCDILFRLVGGPASVDKYIRSLGVKGMAIVATEEQMAQHWDVQYTNWCQPPAMLQLLDIFNQGKKLSKTSSDFLWKIMFETTSAPKRMKGLLAKDVAVAHKTGTSGINDQGVSGATNDVGIIVLPNGRHLAVVAYLSNSTENAETRDEIIAKITKAAFDYYSSK